ncbi:class II aldolase/adducin family protein [Mesosutterella sp. OilRF-GAM-744-9]|uniref:Class II aldolase/adducin family protein n=1 Tax=Mesosutterella porci TaxID=2915351 RepID=A0ABS9MNP8_9BURK|nr:class II aldolase/adducin family protein [Mesosutterella sp. oilRF-744-WT-GAM-9]MCG5030243.1 class II aldolase/adducin family protein [Mesosutterella sp. oilRF-744-WT-GAM-9]
MKPFDNEARARESVIRAALGMAGAGLVVNKAGNVSARCEEGGRTAFLITPSGMDYESLRPADLSLIYWDDGTKQWVHSGPHKPSSEWLMHAEIYRAHPGWGGVVHTHSPRATVLACRQTPIPAFHYMVAASGGEDIPCAKYALFGTPELARNVLEALKERRCCLIAHHGVVAAGSDVSQALSLAVEVENLASMYIELLALGPAEVLTKDQMREVLEKFSAYEDNSRRLSRRESAQTRSDGMPLWKYADGRNISCTEKVKVLDENFREIGRLMADALDDAVLIGCPSEQYRWALENLAAGLKSRYPDQNPEENSRGGS